VTWQPEIWHTVSFDVDTYIVLKFQLSTSSRFEVIRKKVKTWTHLSEKPLSKNNGTCNARAMSQFKCLFSSKNNYCMEV